MFMPQQYFDRVSTIEQYEDDRSAMGRINAWTVAYNVAKERPLIGGGFQMMSPELWKKYLPEEKPHDVHSIYFEVLGEQGFVGLALYLCLMWLAMREGNRIRRQSRRRGELRWAFDLATYTQVSIVAYAVGGAFLGLAYFDLYYHLIGILVLTGMLVDRELASAHSGALSGMSPSFPGRRPSGFRPAVRRQRTDTNLARN
jgi:probable O-glycosylation ligase (exosortase A-associated)